MGVIKGYNLEEFTGFFDNYKFFINPETNEIEIKFICKDCKTLMSKEEMLKGNYQLRVAGPGGPLSYHTAIFRCVECALKLKLSNKEGNKHE